MPCIHCGLPTQGEQNHGTMGDCIQALTAEAIRLRKVIAETPGGPGDRALTAALARPGDKIDLAGS